ncbi:LysM peptidoglycan-binding domain-containing protein, partial [Acinetobacter sp. YH12070]|uniref:LysM peptidoglycan-binding domain-containing protein n=1 Tax=Acinetobacter sp. YH12070 TaxID=2601066 RepID=UPI0015D13EBC
MKGNVEFQFLDLLFNPISNLEYKVEDLKNKVIAAGMSGKDGKTVIISRNLGYILRVSVKKTNGEYKYVGLYCVYKVNDLKIFRSPKVLIKKLKKIENKKQEGKSQPFTYTVKENDKLFDIAKNYNTTVALLCGLNKIKDANKIYKGQKIQVHPNYKATGEKNEKSITKNNEISLNSYAYEVKRGDTLSGIAVKTGLSIGELKNLNNIANINQIYVGQILKLNHNTP